MCSDCTCVLVLYCILDIVVVFGFVALWTNESGIKLGLQMKNSLLANSGTFTEIF